MAEVFLAKRLAGGGPTLQLCGFGTAQADQTAIAAMRKSLPAWAPRDTPGHFLKYADEQTVLAVAAVNQGICSSGLDPGSFQNWAIIAAPRFIGRLAGTATLARFARGGGPAISPHTIPQHSLHSISGALSILLGSRQPNFGVGGAGNSLAEGLLAAFTFPRVKCTGTWLVSTAWSPEPQIDEQGDCTNQPVCHAVALALRFSIAAQRWGQLSLTTDDRPNDALDDATWSSNAATLCRELAALKPGGSAARFAWRLPWNATIVLEAREVLAELAAVA